MNMQRFDWALVRSFLAVLDAGSLMGAARKLQAQQPTLSRHVAELEAQLGTPLFERTGRGVTPTAAALAIADAARQMEAGADALSRSLLRQREVGVGTVRITASQVAAAWLLPPLLTVLQQAEPGIAIELVASNDISNLLRREADIALRMVQPDQSTLIAKRIGKVTLGAYASRDYLRRRGTPKQPADLALHELVGADKSDAILQGFASFGLPLQRENFALRTDDLMAYLEAVRAGLGVGFLADYVARADNALVPILPMLKIPPIPMWLAVHREIRTSRRIREVYDFLGNAVPAAL